MLKEGNNVINGLIQRQLSKGVTEEEVKSSFETTNNAISGLFVV